MVRPRIENVSEKDPMDPKALLLWQFSDRIVKNLKIFVARISLVVRYVRN